MMNIRFVQKMNLQRRRAMHEFRERDLGVYAAALLALIAGLMILFSQVGCNPYKAAWGTTAAVASARNATDDGIAKAFDARVEQCVKDSGGDCKEKCQQCVKGSREYAAILAWRTFVRPSVNAAIQTTVTAISIAEKVDSQTNKLDWIALLKDAVCGVSKVILEFSEVFPDKAKVALGYLGMVKGVTCK
jgi:hypothetical protein